MAALCGTRVVPTASSSFSFRRSDALNSNMAALSLHRAPAAKVCARKQLTVVASETVQKEWEVISKEGEATGKASVTLRVAGANSKGLVHKYLVTTQINARQGNAHTKTRAEVRGGGAKPYAQKGTGRARQGSKRTPLRPGGGVVFGPRTKDWNVSMNKKERRLAMSSALNSAADDIIVIEDIADEQFPKATVKTKDMVAALGKWNVDIENQSVILLCKEMKPAVFQAGRNIEGLELRTLNNMSIYHLLNADKIIVEQSVLPDIQALYGGSSTA